MAQSETNYTHVNENWRQRLRKESTAAKVHDKAFMALDTTAAEKSAAQTHSQACLRVIASRRESCKVRMQVHHDLYDYLIWNTEPTSIQTASTTATVKYFSDGDWMVTRKRIGVHNSTVEDLVQRKAFFACLQGFLVNTLSPSHCVVQGEHLDEPGHALSAAREAHRRVSTKNQLMSCQHRTTSEMTYGARGIGLEMFGVGEHGRLATRTKEPVGNGTKLYHV